MRRAQTKQRQLPARATAHVVDEAVEPAEVVDAALDGGARELVRPHVAREAAAAAALLLHERLGLGGVLLLAGRVHDEHVGALARKVDGLGLFYVVLRCFDCFAAGVRVLGYEQGAGRHRRKPQAQHLLKTAGSRAAEQEQERTAWRTTARPMPLSPPVISATLPLSLSAPAYDSRMKMGFCLLFGVGGGGLVQRSVVWRANDSAAQREHRDGVGARKRANARDEAAMHKRTVSIFHSMPGCCCCVSGLMCSLAFSGVAALAFSGEGCLVGEAAGFFSGDACFAGDASLVAILLAVEGLACVLIGL